MARKKIPMTNFEASKHLLDPATMEIAEQRQTDWRGVIPAGTRAEQLHGRREAFAACVDMLTLGDMLTLITSDEAWMFRCVCVRGDRGKTITDPIVYVLDSIRLPEPEALRMPTTEQISSAVKIVCSLLENADAMRAVSAIKKPTKH